TRSCACCGARSTAVRRPTCRAGSTCRRRRGRCGRSPSSPRRAGRATPAGCRCRRWRGRWRAPPGTGGRPRPISTTPWPSSRSTASATAICGRCRSWWPTRSAVSAGRWPERHGKAAAGALYLLLHHLWRTIMAATETAILAGGCFWGAQDLIRRQPGVVSTRVGYSGGDVPDATYRNHGTHAEAVEIIFDPAVTSFRKLLEFFFQIHDPTTRNRQGNDVGMSYRSAIFYTSEDQKRVA